MAAWKAASEGETSELPVQADVKLAQKLGLTHTPWLFVNGRSLPWPFSREDLELVVEEELAAADETMARGTRAENVYAELLREARPRITAETASAAPCAPPKDGEVAPAYGDVSFVPLCRDLYVDPVFTPAERERVRAGYATARRQLEEVFAPAAEGPIVLVCQSPECRRAVAGPSLRSSAAGIGVKLAGDIVLPLDRPRIAVAGLDSHFVNDLLHEMVHTEFFARIPQADVPMWFREGVAASIGNAPKCRGRMPPAIDDLRRLGSPKAWGSYTDLPGRMDETYCQARAEVEAWGATDGRRRLLELLDGIRSGRSFDELYGPMVVN